MRTEEVADTLGQDRDHELMALYAQALRDLGRFLGERHALDLVAESGGSAARARRARSPTAWRCTTTAASGSARRSSPSNLALAGVATFADLDRLTIFADNLVPHVLRCDGVLRLRAGPRRAIDAGRPLRPGPQEREIRACAVHACELLVGAHRPAAARARPAPVDPRPGPGDQGAPAAPLPRAWRTDASSRRPGCGP